MADFTSDLQNLKPSFSFMDNTDPAMDSLTQFTELNHGVFTDNFHGFLPFSIDSFFHNHSSEIHGSWTENLPGFNQASASAPVVANQQQPIVTAKTEFHESKKRKALDLSESSSGNSSSPRVSEITGIKFKRNNAGSGKRAKSINEKEEEKPREVVHVRARRGQATDSHSLAERVRRGKINERLRCLQDIVPGCYKTMGMAVMLDEIINYVHSLQNQVEFLSMKLTTASIHYDFNTESDTIERMQRAKAQEAKELERLMRGGLA